MNRRDFLAAIGVSAAAVTLHGLPWPAPTPIVDGVVGKPDVFYFKKGDILTFEGLYASDPVTGAKLHYLQEFVVTAEVSA